MCIMHRLSESGNGKEDVVAVVIEGIGRRR